MRRIPATGDGSAGAVFARVATELVHVASPASRARSRGRRALALDLPGFGDSPPDPPGTWARHVEAVERFRREVGLDRVVLVVHDTGGGIGLRWACDHPDAVAGMVITNTGFFPDYEWHEIAKAMRTEGQGEALVDSLSRDGLAALLEAASSGIGERAIDEYWKAFATAGHRRGMLELYRSFDLDELVPYEGRLAELGVPTLVLWGEQDEFLPATTRRVSRGRSPARHSCCSRPPAISSSRTSPSAARGRWSASSGRRASESDGRHRIDCRSEWTSGSS